MGEGVDPTEMCQSLVDKVARSRQLRAITDPELLVLFEDWLEGLEEEVAGVLEGQDVLDAQELARKLGVSARGAAFLLTKLRRGKKAAED